MTKYSVDKIVIGAGLIGSAAAKHLSEEDARAGSKTVLIGPDEKMAQEDPEVPHASHFGETRITRSLDPDTSWSQLAMRSIERYEDIKERSGIDFYTEVGCLAVGPDDAYIESLKQCGTDNNVAFEELSANQLQKRFPFLNAPGMQAIFENESAGIVNPRHLVEAQKAIFEQNGGEIIRDIAVIKHNDGEQVTVITRSGREVTAESVIVAGGAYSTAINETKELELDLVPRTLLFAEVSPDDLKKLEGMPCIIYRNAEKGEHFYMVPPVQFDDGKYYLKIGTSALGDERINSQKELQEWFQGEGNIQEMVKLKRALNRLLPGLSPQSYKSQACVYTCTPNRKPYIDQPLETENLTVATGGNGTSAKSSDEIGRLAARLDQEGAWEESLESVQFQARFRKEHIENSYLE